MKWMSPPPYHLRSPLGMAGIYTNLQSWLVRRFVYPPFASAVSPVWTCDAAGRKGWGTHSLVGDSVIGSGVLLPSFASTDSPVWTCDAAGRKGWGTHSL